LRRGAAEAAQRACQDQNRHLRTRSNFAEGDGAATVGPFLEKQDLGRWPANVILDEEAGAMLDVQSGERTSGARAVGVRKGLGFHGASGDGGPAIVGSTGGASRFFYCPKASHAERDAGLDEFDAAQSLYARGTGLKANRDGSKRSERSESRNIHPTVKPIALARYLARLILPPIPDARMLTPFSGSGSEVIGALQAGWSHVDGIDSWDVAVRISRARIAHWASRIEPVQLDLAGE
jgi:site-specific DNA-methyltransferase (adenine-specific)